MTWFFIDTHERGFAGLGFVDEDQNSIKKHPVKPGALMEVLDKNYNKKDIANTDGIILVHGPGSFSAIRAGVLAGNLLARIYQKPLYAISAEEAKDLPKIINRLRANRLKPVKYADPVYDAKPNITLPKTI